MNRREFVEEVLRSNPKLREIYNRPWPWPGELTVRVSERLAEAAHSNPEGVRLAVSEPGGVVRMEKARVVL